MLYLFNLSNDHNTSHCFTQFNIVCACWTSF